MVRWASATSATRSSAARELRFFNYRDTTPLSGGQVDDSPYGGGAGMVMRVDVVDAALRAAYGDGARPGAGDRCSRRPAARSTTRSPTSSPAEPHLALLCGRYEGVDERVARAPRRRRGLDRAATCSPAASSPAMVVADAVLRKLPGALGHAESAVEESFSEALGGAPEYPHYTRPGQLPRLGGARGAALGRSRAGARVAARAQHAASAGAAGLDRRLRELSTI